MEINGKVCQTIIPINPQGRDEAETAVEELNAILRKHGVWFDITASESPQEVKLIIFVNTSQLKRHAGRKTKGLCLPGDSARCGWKYATVGDIRRMQSEGMTASDIAGQLQISRSTYFRRKAEGASKEDWETF